jgi:tRNA uridine 5-carbamoylmethylation protein Kti12
MIRNNSSDILGEHPLYGYKYSELYDHLNRKRTNSLFWESRRKGDTPLFTLKDHDITRDEVTYISLKRVYLSYDHVPGFEYEFAIDMFNSWDYWVHLVEDSTMRETVQGWRKELDIRNKAKNIRSIMAQASENVQAAKYLVDKGYEVKRPGRVTKQEIENEKKLQIEANKVLEADMKRLGIQVINGSKK